MPPLTDANHAIRARNVTASEVGALLGEHPYVTAGQVWDRLNGLTVPKQPSLSMRFGSDAERILSRFASERLNARLRMNSLTYKHRELPLCATPDAMVTDYPVPFGLAYHRDLVEFKLSFSQDRWRHGLPSDIEWQARAQMLCARRTRVIVYAFCGREYIYVVERDRRADHRLREAVRAFWNDHQLTGIRPADPEPVAIVV